MAFKSAIKRNNAMRVWPDDAAVLLVAPAPLDAMIYLFGEQPQQQGAGVSKYYSAPADYKSTEQ
jgi:hypothetical protein